MVTEFVRGQKSQLSALTAGTDLYVGVVLEGAGEWEVSCFGLDAEQKLSDEDYFIFFNQPKSPEESIQKLGAQAGDTESFRVTLDKVPEKIERLAFCASVDGGTASGISRGYLRIVAGGDEVARYSFTGADFGSERAVMIADVYRKGVWRVAAVGQGFSGGLSELLKSFGGEVADDEPEPAAAPGFAPPAGAAPAGASPGFAPPAGPPPGFAPPAAGPPASAPPSAAAPAAPAQPAPAAVPPQPVTPPPAQAQPAAAGVPAPSAQPAMDGLAPGVAPAELPSQAQSVRPGAMVSLEKFKETQGQARWIPQGHQMVKVTLGQGPTVHAKRGSMVAYQGNIEFDYKGSGGLRQLFEGKMTGQRLELMTCKGQGEVFLADNATDLHVVELNGQRLCINANNVLAFDSSLQTEIKRIESPGLPGGGMFHLEVGGQGSVVIMTHGNPVTLPTVGPTFADMYAVVAWTAGMRVSVSSQVRISRTIYSGVSGESATLQFMGMQGHFVIVQPYEV